MTVVFRTSHKAGLMSITPPAAMPSLAMVVGYRRGESFLFHVIFLRFYLFIFSQRGREGKRGRETSMCGCLSRPLLGTWPTAQACALTGNQTGDPLIHRLALNPLSHTNQGSFTCYFSITVYFLYYFVLVSGTDMVIRQSETLQNVPPNISRTYLAPYRVITILLTIFPVLYFTSP